MDTKPLLYGLTGFFLGGLLVSIAATTFDKPIESASDMSMNQMAESLKNKNGDEFDKAFIAGMIEHHEGAIEMARLSADNAKHAEVKKMSQEIISAQKSEIEEMRQWQIKWGYSFDDATHAGSSNH